MSVLTPLEQIISLAISEAFAGSDVAGLRTTATKSEDGKTWTINGTKKWISGGMHSDYFVREPDTDAPDRGLDPLGTAHPHCQFHSGHSPTADTPLTRR
jgi:alkylation response protein AidB-like acyl-CoA dehydrogenase